MTFNYTDEGNHQSWVDVHQGGSYSRVARVQRFFLGGENVYAAYGGDTFRQDAQMAFNTSASLGTVLLSTTDISLTDAVSAVGIVEDEDAGVARYFYLTYTDDGGGSPTVASLDAYDSPYDDELPDGAGTASWNPLVPLWLYVEQSMRVILINGVTYLYYLNPSGTTTQVNCIALPASGDPAHSNAPRTVAVLDFTAKDRIYVVQGESGRAHVYVGDTDKSPSPRTVLVVDDPAAMQAVSGPTQLSLSAVPFAMSYAAGRGRSEFGVDPFHMFLEPPSSLHDNFGSSILDKPNTGAEKSPFERRTTGSSWILACFNEDGATLEDTMEFTGEDIVPWLGGSQAEAYGGLDRTSATPLTLARVAPPGEDYADQKSSPDYDTSDAYMVHVAVPVRKDGTEEGDVFVFRRDDTTDPELRPHMGNNRTTSNNFDGDPPLPGVGDSGRALSALRVPGSFVIESLQTTLVGNTAPLQLVGAQTQRLDHWRLEDNSAAYGYPENFSSSGTSYSSTNYDPSTDCAHGVQGDLFDDEMLFVVSWHANGGEPPS